jgi:hypothetical protein
MRTRRLRPGLILVALGIVALLALSFSLAAAQLYPQPNVTIVPPQPMASIEFVQESGVERWQVKLTRGVSVEDAHLRVSGSSCTYMGEIYQGMITPLYADMTFKTKSGRTCTVHAIER